MRPNLSRILFRLGARVVRVRSGVGAYVAGRWVETSMSDRHVRAVVQPISPSDRRLLPEGMRTEDAITLFLRPAQTLAVEHSSTSGASSADRVLVDGRWWRIVGEKSWDRNGFREYVAIREAVGAE